MLLSGLDQTIVATASRVIGDDLHGLDQQAWLTTGFLIASTITTLIYGKMSDIFGRKPLFITAVTIFIVGSALCGFATSMPMLTVFRILQGVGAGGLMSLVFAITGDIIPARERARYQGYFAGTMAVSAILGPLVGGLFAGMETVAGVAGWRWAFWINVPLGAVVLLLVSKTLHIQHVRVGRKVDVLGAVLLALGVVPLLLVGEQGGEWGWTSAAALTCYCVGAAGVAGFVWQQFRMRNDALLPLDLFAQRTFSIPVVLSFLVGAVQFAATLLTPLYFQIVRGMTPSQAGLMLIPMVLALAATSIVVGRLVRRTGHTKIFMIIGATIQTVGLLGFALVTTDTSLWYIGLAMVLVGIGLGTSGNVVLLMLQNSVDFSRLGVASASGSFFRSIGATTGTAVLLSILFTRAGATIANAYHTAAGDPAFAAAAAADPEQLRTLKAGLSAGLSDTSFLNSLDAALAHPFLLGFTEAMNTAALISAGIAAAGVVLALFLTELPLRTMSGQAAAKAALADNPDAPSATAPNERHAS
jgi:EmrB/QacA subfamily drug resistance transporter